MKAKVITLPEIQIETAQVEIVGTTGLLCQRMGQKAMNQLRESGKAGKGKGKPRVIPSPEDQFKECLYPYPSGGYGFPAKGFLLSCIRVSKTVGMHMVDAATSGFRFIGEFNGEDYVVKIDGTPEIHESTVILNKTVRSPRYRALFPAWTTKLTVKYNPTIFDLQQIVNLLQYAGHHVGVGEWRPERRGDFGTFTIKPTNQKG